MNNLMRFPTNIDDFSNKHIGSSEKDISEMLTFLNYSNLDDFIEHAIPPTILSEEVPNLNKPLSEMEAMEHIRKLVKHNEIKKSYIGKGYHASIMPEVVRRNIFEQPGWYTSYTPYQPEISQGRLEMLFYFQTMISEITKLDISNASLLDESTAAAEAAFMARAYLESNVKGDIKPHLFVDRDAHPQTIAVLRTRLKARGIDLKIGFRYDISEAKDCFAAVLQYPSTSGEVYDLKSVIDSCKSQEMISIIAADLMSLIMLKPPGDCGADISVGSTQRFGLPLGYGGPHAGFLSCLEEYKRLIPGRLVGQSIDKRGAPSYRLSLQSREQHIRRERASSNICTAQAFLATLSTAYAIHHGKAGLEHIANRIYSLACTLAEGLNSISCKVINKYWFDTISVERVDTKVVLSRLNNAGYNVYCKGKILTIALDETTTLEDIYAILQCFSLSHSFDNLIKGEIKTKGLPEQLLRSDNYLTQEVFRKYSSETELMRYLKMLKDRDLSLDKCMIPLGSCTMKLNAASIMTAIGWSGFTDIHPLVPSDQAQGYEKLIQSLQDSLCEITGLPAFSMQPNSGANGEYAGLLTIRNYYLSKGEANRNICMIPISAHGTNPASASLAGMKVVPVKVSDDGTIDIFDYKQKLNQYKNEVACIMITYPSTYGIYNEDMHTLTKLTHEYGAQVYMDGANLNALVGLSRPSDLGVDVMHLNLHKTFSIPHGGGGPGMGPIAAARHLEPFLPSHPWLHEDKDVAYDQPYNTVSGAPYGSPLILIISYMYIIMMGLRGLYKATLVAVLHANYIAKRLSPYYSILYKGDYGLVAHECIVDIRGFKQTSGISVEDIAKRLIDYGFHAPTMSFPVAGTLMVEPTESESKYEIDRFCDAMIDIRQEIKEVEKDTSLKDNNLLSNAPHTIFDVVEWPYSYSIKDAILPKAHKGDKYWPPVNRVDNTYGDRNLICSCPPMDEYKS